MTQHSSPPRLRALTWAATALGLLVLASALVWLIAPDLGPYLEGRMPVQHLLPGPLWPAGIQAALGVIASAAGLAALSGLARQNLTAAGAIVAGAGAAVGFIGFNGLAISGYLLAALVPIGIAVGLVTLLARRPLVGIAVAIPVLTVAAFAVFGPIPFPSFYGMLVQTMAADPALGVQAVLLILAAGTWLLWGTLQLRGSRSRFGDFVLRHRIAITVLAACCALPYAVARASWLTPWPLFGGSREAFTAMPQMQVIGLMLGLAMVVGGVLTLGLVLPWGSRVPRWIPVAGGRPVPVALAVVPASIVAVLFTSCGVETVAQMVASVGGYPVALVELVFVLPFWLWGPLLALAAWAYAQHRAAAPAHAAAPAPAPAP